MSQSEYFIIILTNDDLDTFYTGITDNLKRSMDELGKNQIPEKLKQYNLTRLVYVEKHKDRGNVFRRQAELNLLPKEKKVNLILTKNPKMTNISK
jgi:predicted GIY-YIG superfamily endonuclease